MKFIDPDDAASDNAAPPSSSPLNRTLPFKAVEGQLISHNLDYVFRR